MATTSKATATATALTATPLTPLTPLTPPTSPTSPARPHTPRADLDADYAATAPLDALRAREYGYLDEQQHVYLDYAGAGLAARAQHAAHAARLAGALLGNPHSASPTSAAATALIDRTRARIRAFFNADADDYVVIFTSNASAAARLVGEAYPFGRRCRLVLTADNHNSLHGIREFARRRHARTVYVPARGPDLRVDTAQVEAALPVGWGCGRRRRRRGLFAYPAQSNFSGVQHPLEWVRLAQARGYDVLLDAAAFLPTADLDLAAVPADFVIASWYKLFGYPTGVGCLVARRDALARLSRPWFAGGTVQAVAVAVARPWHSLAAAEAAFEDGTPNFLSVADVHVGLDWLAAVGRPLVATRVRCLTAWFLSRLERLRHSDGSPMARIYGPATVVARGGTVAFNVLDSAGVVVDERRVAADAAVARISVRTGCFCNPGAAEAALGIDPVVLARLRRSRVASVDEYVRLLGLPSGGAVRVSFGIASSAADVDRFFVWLEATYRDRIASSDGLKPRDSC